jgi:hypothetical protein
MAGAALRTRRGWERPTTRRRSEPVPVMRMSDTHPLPYAHRAKLGALRLRGIASVALGRCTPSSLGPSLVPTHPW